MIKAAIFDVDGVILDSLIVWNDLGERYLRAMNIEPEKDINSVLFSMSMEQGAMYLKSHYGLDISERQIMLDVQNMVQDFYYNQVQLKKGAKRVLDFLLENNIPMAVATSSQRTHIEKAFARLGIIDYFDVILTTSEVGQSKYFPDIYEAAARAMNAKNEQILVFEDSLYALKTAVKAGFVGVGVRDDNGEPNQLELMNTGRLYLEKIDDLIYKWEVIQ